MKKTVSLLKALGENNRLRAFHALLLHEHLCLCEIAELLDIAPSTASRHMSLLAEAGAVTCQKRGKWVYYGLSGNLDSRFLQWLTDSLAADSSLKEDDIRLRALLEHHECNCPSRTEKALSKL
ncbi:MAG TPA: metalloregulator ArsR/SmtB family transcription factor [Synergistaceae bacterium]|nr:metalloregulator ArsR/SmtB family transcription factor [Synergistaceae bacterium]HPJ26316.1 metalloregulator ArsR/SmtB family transcription factor [Synergistaceae bacterium]HPQ37296.1 metalloregulator ArsR/SmtB family transcription factor [Synergistaceae bacterium]